MFTFKTRFKLATPGCAQREQGDQTCWT